MYGFLAKLREEIFRCFDTFNRSGVYYIMYIELSPISILLQHCWFSNPSAVKSRAIAIRKAPKFWYGLLKSPLLLPLRGFWRHWDPMIRSQSSKIEEADILKGRRSVEFLGKWNVLSCPLDGKRKKTCFILIFEENDWELSAEHSAKQIM